MSRRALWWRAGLLLAIGAVVYANSLSGPFIFDDHDTIVENAEIRDWRLQTALFPHREAPTAGRPIVNLSFAINYAVGGLRVTGYHVVNVAIHLFCSLVLFGLIRRTLQLHGIPAALRQRSLDIAFAVALLWLVHPLTSEAVDYITQRTESLMALFYLLTLYCAVVAQAFRPAERGAKAPPHTRLWTAAAVLACALGMGCKESMVTAPIAVLVYDRIFLYDSFKSALRARRILYGGLAATWLLLAVILVAGPRVHSAGFSSGVSPWTYLLNQCVMIVRYLRLAVWPRSLVLAYGIPLPLSFADVLPHTLIIVALLALTAVALIRQPRLGFLGAWFFLTLAPASTIVPIATEVGAERRMYLPLMAVLAGAVVAVAPRLRKTAAVALLAALSAALGTQTLFRNREYASPLTMATTVLDRWPTGFAHALVGVELARAGHRDEALPHLREAVKSYPKAHFNYGVELFAIGNLDEALAELQQFVREQPQLLEAVRARTLIGRGLLTTRRYAEAMDQFRLVQSMTAPSAEAHVTATGLLGDACFAQGRFGEAAAFYRTFLAFRPHAVGALTNFGIALASTGQSLEAMQTFRRAVEAGPTDVTARRNLAKALFNEGQAAAAESETDELLRLNPDDAGGHDLKGRLLASRGRLTEARAEFERAIQLDPHDQQAREDLDLLVRTLRGK